MNCNTSVAPFIHRWRQCPGYEALKSCGGSGEPFKFRESFALAGVRGAPAASAKELRDTEAGVELQFSLSEICPA